MVWDPVSLSCLAFSLTLPVDPKKNEKFYLQLYIVAYPLLQKSTYVLQLPFHHHFDDVSVRLYIFDHHFCDIHVIYVHLVDVYPHGYCFPCRILFP